MNQDRVFFFDTTLRDGEQSPGCSMTIPEKLRMAHALEALGVDIIEAGFAIASPGDRAAIRDICREVRRPRIASLARARSEDIQAAAQSVEEADRDVLGGDHADPVPQWVSSGAQYLCDRWTNGVCYAASQVSGTLW